MKNKLKHFICDILLRLLWKLCDSPYSTIQYLGDVYYNVPKEIENVLVFENVFHFIDDKDSRYEEVLEWLSDDIEQ